MKIVIYVFLLFLCCKYTVAGYYDVRNLNFTTDPGEPLFLTEYLEKGLIVEGREKARVRYFALSEVESYAGLITINKKYNSNTFFWFFPSQTNPKHDPVILWFIGGPAISMFASVFTFNGAFQFLNENVFVTRNWTLTKNHNVIYVDNPIGTGYSFTDNDAGYARNQSDVAHHIILFLTQFLQMFPDYRRNDFYTGGDSYGGKFVVSVANAIRRHNENGGFYINLKGIIAGNGLLDLEKQGTHSEFFYQIGIVDKKGREELKNYEIEGKIGSVGDEINDLLPNITGFIQYTSILNYNNTYNRYYETWTNSSDFRRAVHVGNLTLNFTSDVARSFFEAVNQNPVTQCLEELLQNNYRVLVYNGQIDALFPYTSSLNIYHNLNWTGVEDYIDSERKQWFVDGELAGYVKVAGIFHEVLVRNTTHVTFYDNPKWTSELITRYTHHRPIAQAKLDKLLIHTKNHDHFMPNNYLYQLVQTV